MPPRPALLLLPLLIAACAGPEGDYPRLLPLEEVLTPPLPAHALGVATNPDALTASLRAEAAALEARAAVTGTAASTDSRLLARAAALRARAAALREAGT